MHGQRSRQINRPRPSHSCFTCRQRKVKCGREQPVCANCTRLNLECAFESQQSKDAKTNKNTSSQKSKDQQQQQREQNSTPSNRSRSSSIQASRSCSPGQEPDQAWMQFQDPSQIPHSLAMSTTDMTAHIHPTADGMSFVNPFTNPMNAPLTGSIEADPVFSFPPNFTPADPTQARIPPQQRTRSQWEMPDGNFYRRPHRDTISSRSSIGDMTVEDGWFMPLQPRSFSPRDSLQGSRQGSAPTDDIGTSLPGYMTTPTESKPRFVEGTFWALIKGHETVCDELLYTSNSHNSENQRNAIDTNGLADIINYMPNKALCDTLMYSFLIGVRPLLPIIHVSSFISEYEEFYNWSSENKINPMNFGPISDPTFFCLLFSVLYCGAVAAHPALWQSPPLREQNRDEVVSRLNAMFSKSLALCNHTVNPTTHTLSAFLLGHSCSRQNSESHEEPYFVALVVRMAQNLGMHREADIATFNPKIAEIRRRIWWHIVGLDCQVAIVHGSRLCCNTSDYEVKMVHNQYMEEFYDTSHQFAFLFPQSIGYNCAPTSILALGRYEAVRFVHSMLARFQNGRSLGQIDFNNLLLSVKRLHNFIDGLIKRLPVDGIPEKGYIPAKLANASPMTHKKLYGDDASAPTVFSCWARIMLSMLKMEVAIIMQKYFLVGSPDTQAPSNQNLWDNAVNVCVSYLRTLLYVGQVPAFAPYQWFHSTRNPPLSAILIALIYSSHNPRSPTSQIARYLVDEVIRLFTGDEVEGQNSDGSQAMDTDVFPAQNRASFDKSCSEAWRFIKAMRSNMQNLGQQPGKRGIEDAIASSAIMSGVSGVSSAASDTNSIATSVTGSRIVTPSSPSSFLGQPTGIPNNSPARSQGMSKPVFSDSMIDLSDMGNWSRTMASGNSTEAPSLDGFGFLDQVDGMGFPDPSTTAAGLATGGLGGPGRLEFDDALWMQPL